MRDSDEDPLRRGLYTEDGIDDTIFKMATYLLPTVGSAPPNYQSRLRPCVKTNSFAHRADPLSAVTSNHALQLRFPRSNAPIVFQ